jgi:hypothetical protein
VEVSYQLLSDVAGEGDGLHRDIWFTVPSRTDFSPPNVNTSPCQGEVDMAEAELSSTTFFGGLDNNTSIAGMPNQTLLHCRPAST